MHVLPNKMNHRPFGRGGGLSIFVRGNTSDINITIDSCNFKQNNAIYGGALYVQLNNNVHGNNNIIVRNTTFNENMATYGNDTLGGGGAGLTDYVYGFDSYLSPIVTRNELAIQNCTFSSNTALKGGALCIF